MRGVDFTHFNPCCNFKARRTLYNRGFQPGVRVPLGVREGLSGGTRAPFYLLKKKIFHNSSAGAGCLYVWINIFLKSCVLFLGGTHRRPSILKGYADEKRLKTPALQQSIVKLDVEPSYKKSQWCVNRQDSSLPFLDITHSNILLPRNMLLIWLRTFRMRSCTPNRTCYGLAASQNNLAYNVGLPRVIRYTTVSVIQASPWSLHVAPGHCWLILPWGTSSLLPTPISLSSRLQQCWITCTASSMALSETRWLIPDVL